MQISSLARRPAFADVIADRGWHAWWQDSDVSLAQYRSHLDPMMGGDAIPFALIAHEADRYLGSVLVIACDLETRSQYSPWIAALWVEPDSRKRGIGAELLGAARDQAARCGEEACYLCATPENSPYYLARGFRQIETDVSGLNVFSV